MEPLKLKNLIKIIGDKAILKGDGDLSITGICSDSRQIYSGELFIAKPGTICKGEEFLADVVRKGAAAILSDKYHASYAAVPQIIYEDVAAAEVRLAEVVFNYPSQKLFMVGITGTNGKTTSTFLIKHLLEANQEKCGIIGTIAYLVGSKQYPATNTTPGVIDNQRILHEMVLEKCQSAVMEVSSHALKQGRVRGITYDITIFTNLTPEHLDYHKTMEDYFESKLKLFQNNPESLALINLDDPWGEKIAATISNQTITYGIEKNTDLRASKIKMHTQGTTFDLTYKKEQVSCFSPLVGTFNVYNYLTAAGAGLAKGFSLGFIAESLAKFDQVPGRLEMVKNSLGRKIYIDYAHTDDALANVLKTLKQIKGPGRIITLFGCGGDRDKTKRPRMAKVAEELSDLVIVTTDNPRSEEPEDIARDIVKGFSGKNYFLELDRAAAIRKAISISQEEDLILIAGKGHETYQILKAGKTIHFDDREVVQKIMDEGRCLCEKG